MFTRHTPLILFTLFLSSCNQQGPQPTAPKAIHVEVVKISPADIPVTFTFVGQTRSSRQVEIRARVDGFLDKITYEEGKLVEPNQVLFELDKSPYEAALQEANGILAVEEARLFTAGANLKRIRPLAEKDAVSQKDLDDAIGIEKAAQGSVLSAQGKVREAELNLSYATIFSPLRGLASKAVKREGSYVPTGTDSLLTYVAQVDPIWVNFSISENQVLKLRQEIREKKLIEPKDSNYEVEIVFGDKTKHPYRGRINFTEPNVDSETGTFLIRAQLPNPEEEMRPGQFVRVVLYGAKRTNAITVPQSAVIQGSKGHFVWVVNGNKPSIRMVEVGPWQGDNWFINQGLLKGDKVIVSNIMKLNPKVPIKIVR